MILGIILYGFFFPFVILANGLWYFIKYVVAQNGYETHLFYGHFNDIANLHRLIRKEKDAHQKRFFTLLLIAFYSIFLFFFGAIVWLISTQ